MKGRFKIILFTYLTFILANNFLARGKEDSLLILLNKETKDSLKVDLMIKLSELFGRDDFQKAFMYANKAFEHSRLKGDKFGMSSSLVEVGFYFYQKGDYNTAKAKWIQSRKFLHQSSIFSKDDLLNNNIAMAELALGRRKEAITIFFEILKNSEKKSATMEGVMALNNIGKIYTDMQDYDNSIKYYYKCYALCLKMNLGENLPTLNNNIGFIFLKRNQLDSAEHYFNKALALLLPQNKQKDIIANLYNNLGEVFQLKKNNKKALEYYNKSLQIRREIKYKDGLIFILRTLGNYYLDQEKNQALAIKYLNEAYSLAKETKALSQISATSKKLSSIYQSRNNKEKELFFYKEHVAAKDSLKFRQLKNEINNQQMKFEFEKKIFADSMNFENQHKIKDVEIAAQKTDLKAEKNIRVIILSGLALLLISLFFLFNRFKLIQKQNRVIEKQKFDLEEKNETLHHQKEIIEEKQTEILDSINYAKRIQYTLLANEALLNENLGEHFVLFKPKDIVSGDFYWAANKDNGFYLAACDSTGHGVPGAFMSLLNISFLNEAVLEKNIHEPNQILNHVRKRLVESMDGGKDGMDAILFCFNKRNNTLIYSAANNCPVLIRNKEIIELAKNKMPIGKGENNADFIQHTLELQKGDCLYLYTDGFADQFGGPKGKKFKYRQLNELLLSSNNLSSVDQNKLLTKTFESWKGELQQIDDVLLIGIKV